MNSSIINELDIIISEHNELLKKSLVLQNNFLNIS